MNHVKLTRYLLIPIAAMLVLPAQAYARHDGDRGHRHHYGSDDTRFERRLDRQRDRIRDGVKSGELTRKEASKLRDQQKRIAKQAKKFQKDGELSRTERRKLEAKQDKASRAIYRQKHDSEQSSRRYGSHRRHFYDYKPYSSYYRYKPSRYHYRFNDNDHYSLTRRWFDDDYSLILRLWD